LLSVPAAAVAGAIGGAVAGAHRASSTGVALACPTFQGGHRYVVLSRLNKAKTAWHPLVWDMTSLEWVDIACSENAPREDVANEEDAP
jgi:hypothetical protein